MGSRKSRITDLDVTRIEKLYPLKHFHFYAFYISSYLKNWNCSLFTHGILRSSEELKKLVEMCPCVPDGIGIWKCWFLKRGETGVPGGKPLGARERTNNKLNPHMTSTPGFEPRSHWWEANALTTAPLLLPKRGNGSCFKTVFLKAKKRLRMVRWQNGPLTCIWVSNFNLNFEAFLVFIWFFWM